METLSGLAAARGVVAGPVFLCHDARDVAVPEYTVPADGVPAELARYRDARVETRRQIEALAARLREGSVGPEADIFDNHLVLFDDPTIVSGIERLIREERLNAEAAVRKTVAEFRAVFGRMHDPYLRERVRDLDDLERRVLDVLLGRSDNPFAAIASPVVIVARDLTPSETVALPRDLVLALVTDRGSVTSHVALLARALGIPAVVGLGDVTGRVQAGDEVLVDGTHGEVTLHANAATTAEFGRLVLRERELRALLAEDRAAPRTDVRVRFCANVQPGVPLQNLADCGAEGVGLYRSEYLWLSDGATPDEAVQTAAYEKAVCAVAKLGPDARTVIRVLDLGGDKLVRGLKAHEANPFLGNRSIRWLLTHRNVFRTQLRAILRASAKGPAAVMYPMVAVVDELLAANAELEAAKAALRAEGVPFDANLPRGCMIEIPSAALNAGRFAREVDFFSVGTNDLVQYTFAADRGNARVSHLGQPANPAVLKLLDMTFRAARAAGISASVCGESASDPVLGVLWVALGADALSMSPSFIPVLRSTFRGLTRADLDGLAARVRGAWDEATAADIYGMCRSFLSDKVPRFAEIQSFFQNS